MDTDTKTLNEIYTSTLDAARATAVEALKEVDLEALRNIAAHSDRSTLEIVCNVLRRLGAFSRQTEASLEEVMRSIPVIPQYDKLVRRWLLDLADEDILVRTPHGLGVHRLYELTPPSIDQNPHFEGVSGILLEVLTGKHHVLEYVFGKRRPAWFTAYTASAYDTDPIFVYQHAIVGEIALRIATIARRDRPVRVIEVGAGMGGLTAKLLPLLPPGMSSYLYTDVTRAFLDQAKQRFAEADDVISYGLYDINKSPQENATPESHFDLVVAFDVLHCARDLGRTLAWLRALLLPGGILINEQLTRNRPGHLIIPGIMPGFTDFNDERLRDYRTLFTPGQWLAKLLAAGFVDGTILPEDARLLEDLGHGVVVARNAPYSQAT